MADLFILRHGKLMKFPRDAEVSHTQRYNDSVRNALVGEFTLCMA